MEMLVKQPPVDWLCAWRWGYKAPGTKAANLVQAKQENVEALRQFGNPRRKLKDMPAYIRDSPATKATIEKLKAEWRTNST